MSAKGRNGDLIFHRVPYPSFLLTNYAPYHGSQNLGIYNNFTFHHPICPRISSFISQQDMPSQLGLESDAKIKGLALALQLGRTSVTTIPPI